jgi:co-chaperonin GroES (HSP10)
MTERKIIAIRDHIIVEDMEFGEQKTSAGIIIINDDGKSHGIKPRWALVHAVGPKQKDVKVGEYVLVEHGRWTRGFEMEREDGSNFTIRRIDNDCILMSSDEKPSDAYVAEEKLLDLKTN